MQGPQTSHTPPAAGDPYPNPVGDCPQGKSGATKPEWFSDYFFVGEDMGEAAILVVCHSRLLFRLERNGKVKGSVSDVPGVKMAHICESTGHRREDGMGR